MWKPYFLVFFIQLDKSTQAPRNDDGLFFNTNFWPFILSLWSSYHNRRQWSSSQLGLFSSCMLLSNSPYLYPPAFISHLLSSVQRELVLVTVKADDTLLLLMRELGCLSATTHLQETEYHCRISFAECPCNTDTCSPSIQLHDHSEMQVQAGCLYSLFLPLSFFIKKKREGWKGRRRENKSHS